MGAMGGDVTTGYEPLERGGTWWGDERAASMYREEVFHPPNLTHSYLESRLSTFE